MGQLSKGGAMTKATVTEPGTARCPGISVQDLLASDSRPVPDYLSDQSYELLGDADIPYARDTSRVVFEKEVTVEIRVRASGGCVVKVTLLPADRDGQVTRGC